MLRLAIVALAIVGALMLAGANGWFHQSADCPSLKVTEARP